TEQDTTTTSLYTHSLHDAHPIYESRRGWIPSSVTTCLKCITYTTIWKRRSIGFLLYQRISREYLDRLSIIIRFKESIMLFRSRRSEEHTSDLQSRENLVCRLLLE